MNCDVKYLLAIQILAHRIPDHIIYQPICVLDKI